MYIPVQICNILIYFLIFGIIFELPVELLGILSDTWNTFAHKCHICSQCYLISHIT
ncbi:hypothetical protein F383_31646 [Gossypium arboreum]|uniref:Uncharacterized protein n=1 Tax=Gossypium arboreum TaxID=29729 RepID=A0A0B0N0U0_GOSAR|nr:hypothetical protein F383_31646 [Gossypium arboreum]